MVQCLIINLNRIRVPREGTRSNDKCYDACMYNELCCFMAKMLYYTGCSLKSVTSRDICVHKLKIAITSVVIGIFTYNFGVLFVMFMTKSTRNLKNVAQKMITI